MFVVKFALVRYSRTSLVIFIPRPLADIEEWVLGHSALGIELQVVHTSCGLAHSVFRLICDSSLHHTCFLFSATIMGGAVAAGLLDEDFYM